MKKERRYLIYLMNNKSYEIDEEDLQKLKDNAGEMLVQLKQVMVHPSSITAVEPIFKEYRSTTTISTSGAPVLSQPAPPPPLKDLFEEDNTLKLT